MRERERGRENKGGKKKDGGEAIKAGGEMGQKGQK